MHEAIAALCGRKGLPAPTHYAVRNWKTRNSIPSEYWTLVIKAAAALDVVITTDQLARMAAAKLAA